MTNLELIKTTRKLIIVGNSSVGKSSLLVRYLNDEFSEGSSPTINVTFSNVPIVNHDGMKIELQIWDTAGSEQYRSMQTHFFRESDIALVCFDYMDEPSKNDISVWVEMIEEQSPDCIFYLVATKSDTYGELLSAAEDFLKIEHEKEDSPFMQTFMTSAKKNQNIGELFQALADQKIYIRQNTPDKKKLEKRDQEKCC